jgi:ribosome biogenesis SPOUT family RNA methylase Rps3
VCEFDDDAKMQKGIKTMNQLKLPNREIITHKLSTVAINRLGETQPSKDTAKKVAAAARAF